MSASLHQHTCLLYQNDNVRVRCLTIEAVYPLTLVHKTGRGRKKVEADCCYKHQQYVGKEQYQQYRAALAP